MREQHILYTEYVGTQEHSLPSVLQFYNLFLKYRIYTAHRWDRQITHDLMEETTPSDVSEWKQSSAASTFVRSCQKMTQPNESEISGGLLAIIKIALLCNSSYTFLIT